MSRPTLHPHTIYQTSGYPVPTLDHSSIYAYPTPHQNPGPDPFPGQTHSRARSVQVFPATQHPQIIPSRKYKHADTAPLNNFFTFTYPAARDGPRPGRITPSHMYTDDVRVGRTPGGTPEPLLNFRKIQ